MNKKFVIFAMLVILLILPVVMAKEYHMKLLAIKESNEDDGSDADLYLEIIPGSGRIFLDTFPLTRFDTQISTRFAKEIACNFLDINCDNHDFIYTIRSNSAIIGGPSASAAIAVLTVAGLKKMDINQNTSITGIINSGGIISPIGGLKGKIDAGSKIGLKKILIPKGQGIIQQRINVSENLSSNISNQTYSDYDIIAYGKSKGVEIIEVTDLNEAIFEFTGKRLYQNNHNLSVNVGYMETMRILALDLCNRSKELKSTISSPLSEEFTIIFEEANNLTKRANDAFKNKEYYSTASFCFGANTKYSYIYLKQLNLNNISISKKINNLKEQIAIFSKELDDREIKTITDLETYMIVNERLTEADSYIRNSIVTNETDVSLDNLAYAIERFSSAKSWYKFFDNRGKQFKLDKEILRNSCQNKLSEVEERVQYVSTFFPSPLINVNEEINNAFIDFQNQNYKLCLFKASKAKAEVDIILSTLGVGDIKIGSLLDIKLEVAQKNIIKQIQNDIFPILGYSYYEYAKSLKETNQLSALLFSEYSLELSNLDIYFKEKERISLFDFDSKFVMTFFTGLITGILITFIFISRYKKKVVKRYKRSDI